VYVQEGDPVPSYFGKKVTNPNDFAEPIIQDNSFLGSAYANHLAGVSTTLRFRDLSLDVLGEYQGGGMLNNFTGYQNENRGVWYPCYDTQKKIRRAVAGDATALSDVTAMQRAKCAIDPTKYNADFWIQATNFFKLRSASLAWKLPEGLVPRTSSATLTVSGRNLFKSTDYDGLDPELRDASDQGTRLGRREYYQLPPSKQFVVSLRVLF
jgi:hypothetical protein